MGRFAKFLILAMIGFGMGAGLAWFQSGGGNPFKTAATEQSQDADAPDETATRMEALPQEDIIPGAPDMPAADTIADIYGDDEAAPAVVEELEKPATADIAPVAPAPVTTQKVAGSTVGGAFSLTDQDGKAVTEKSWPGKKKLVFFGFTHCPDICPTTLDKMTAALGALGEDAGTIQPIFVTTDPKRDTPERMKEYLADYAGGFAGLTGTDAQIDAIKDVYKVYAAKASGGDPENYLIDHSGYVYLMSEDDVMLEIFGSSDTAETIAAKAKPHL